MTRVDLSKTGATDAVVDFATGVSLADVPAAVLDRAVDDLTDTIGVLLGGSVEPAAERVRAYLRDADQLPGPVALLGRAGSATRTGAALAHGVAIHALDYDDTGHPGNVHPSSHVLPALWSLAAGRPVNGASFVLAYLIGLEVENKIGACLPAERRNLRFHPTGVIGPMAAAAAGSRLAGLSPDQTRMALGAAASMGAGVRANVGSDVKPLHAGRSAASGVEAVLLARNGLLACPAVLDVRYGFFDAFRGAVDFAEFDTSPLDQLGRSWDLQTEFGIALKPFPCCACAHPGIEAALAIAEKVDPADIAAVDVGTSAYALSIVGDPAPETETQARFSMPFCVAVALVRKRVGLASFTDVTVRDPDIRRVMGLVSVRVDETLRDDPEHPAIVTVTLRSGERVSHAVPFASGKPARWFTRERLFDKFSDCAGIVLAGDQVGSLYDWTQAVRDCGDVGELSQLARPV
jgi:2-methylcitrate dehydratase PrpD